MAHINNYIQNYIKYLTIRPYDMHVCNDFNVRPIYVNRLLAVIFGSTLWADLFKLPLVVNEE